VSSDIRLRFLDPRQPPLPIVPVRLIPFRFDTRFTDRTSSQRPYRIRRRNDNVHEFVHRLRYVRVHHRAVRCVTPHVRCPKLGVIIWSFRHIPDRARSSSCRLVGVDLGRYRVWIYRVAVVRPCESRR